MPVSQRPPADFRPGGSKIKLGGFRLCAWIGTIAVAAFLTWALMRGFGLSR